MSTVSRGCHLELPQHDCNGVEILERTRPNGVNRVARDAERIEERAVLLGVVPEIDSVGVKPVFAGDRLWTS